LSWYHHGAQGGPAAITTTGGVAEFDIALAAWSKIATIKLIDAGATTLSGGLNTQDGVNAIYFEDPDDDIPGSFDCINGGVLGQGGPFAYDSPPLATFRSIGWGTIVEGNAVIQDGLGLCDWIFNTSIMELYTHELGHAHGMGHSCGDTASGACVTGSIYDDAVMRADFHNDGRGASPRTDDIHGMEYLYCATDPCICTPAPNACGTRSCGTVVDSCGNVTACGTTCNTGTCDAAGQCQSCTPNPDPCGTRSCGIVTDGCNSANKFICGELNGGCPFGLKCNPQGVCNLSGNNNTAIAQPHARAAATSAVVAGMATAFLHLFT